MNQMRRRWLKKNPRGCTKMFIIFVSCFHMYSIYLSVAGRIMPPPNSPKCQLPNAWNLRICSPIGWHVKEEGIGGRPKDIQTLIPGTYECYFVWQVDFAAIIKNYPGLSRWALSALTRVLIRRRKREISDRRERGYVMEAGSERAKLLSCWLCTTGRGHEPGHERNTAVE